MQATYESKGTLALKTGSIEFAWLESTVDATHANKLSPEVAMAAEPEVHNQRPPAGAQCLSSSFRQITYNRQPPSLD